MAKGQRRVGEGGDEVLRQLPEACRDERAAVEFIEMLRWGGEPACPRCGDTHVAEMKDRQGNRSKRFLWRCYGCKKQFTVRIGTIFEDSRIPLRIWCHGFWRACSSKKGVSALQIKRETGLSYKSALFLMHRIRFAMQDDHGLPPKLRGVVEVDEAYIGGKPRYKVSQRDPRTKKLRDVHYQYRLKWTDKTPILALVERGGDIRTRVIERVDKATLGRAVRELVAPGSTVYTDENQSYKHLGRGKRYAHDFVTHSKGEYARGPVSTNTVEGFFALVKRGVYGTFHSVSKHRLPLYLAEFEYRYNTRKLNDGERTARAIRKADGKRLHYRG